MTQTTHSRASSGSKQHIDAPPKAPLWVIVVKWIGIAAALVLGAIAIQRLIEMGWWLGVVIVGAIASAILVVYGRRKGVALKFILPGLLLLLALQVWPVAIPPPPPSPIRAMATCSPRRRRSRRSCSPP
ncbi:MAG: hypothetical protein R2722_00345 [Tessaracoccus sp.]